MEDAEIIKLYFDRDEAAVTEIAEKYGSYCYTIAFNVLGSEEDSKETVNDTYLETWNSIPPHCPTVFSAFIGKITRRLAITEESEFDGQGVATYHVGADLTFNLTITKNIENYYSSSGKYLLLSSLEKTMYEASEMKYGEFNLILAEG